MIQIYPFQILPFSKLYGLGSLKSVDTNIGLSHIGPSSYINAYIEWTQII